MATRAIYKSGRCWVDAEGYVNINTGRGGYVYEFNPLNGSKWLSHLAQKTWCDYDMLKEVERCIAFVVRCKGRVYTEGDFVY